MKLFRRGATYTLVVDCSDPLFDDVDTHAKRVWEWLFATFDYWSADRWTLIDDENAILEYRFKFKTLADVTLFKMAWEGTT